MHVYYSLAQITWVEPGIFTTNKDTTVRETIVERSLDLQGSGLLSYPNWKMEQAACLKGLQHIHVSFTEIAA